MERKNIYLKLICKNKEGTVHHFFVDDYKLLDHNSKKIRWDFSERKNDSLIFFRPSHKHIEEIKENIYNEITKQGGILFITKRHKRHYDLVDIEIHETTKKPLAIKTKRLFYNLWYFGEERWYWVVLFLVVCVAVGVLVAEYTK